MTQPHADSARGFADRVAAGRALAGRLSAYRGRDDVVVLGLPRGGVPVAAEVARALGSPLDVVVVRKLGVPAHEELAVGAIAESGAVMLNDDVVSAEGVTRAELDAVVAYEFDELERRRQLYRRGVAPIALTGKTAVVIDDGLATGATMRAAIMAVRDRGAAAVVVAAPVAAGATCADLRALADAVVCVITPHPFTAVGTWYRDFQATSDEEVIRLLESQ